MTFPSNWLSPTAMHSLGWTLVHFLWQGTALAAVAAAAMVLCRRAATRYVVGVGALCLMLLAPFATFFFLERPASTEPARFSASVAQVWPATNGANESPASKRSSSGSPSPDVFPWLIEGWLIGVAFFSLRTAGGFLVLERQQRRQSTPVSGKLLAICLQLQHRLGLSRVIRFSECTWLQTPAVIGWFRPVVLLPLTALTGLSEDQLHAVIAHELAHIQRLDAFVNVFQVCVETLLFYHPAVWWLNKRIRAEREHCCDDMAIALCGNAFEYARALTLMEEWRSAPAFAMAANGGPLSERIARLLGLRPVPNATRRVGLTASIFCVGAALVAGNALLGIAYPKPIAYASGGLLPRPALSVTAVMSQAQPAAQAAATRAAKPSPAQTSQRAEQTTTGESYIDALKSVGLTELTPDELVALKIQGVTPEYVRGMRELGLHPDADGLVGLKVQGVTPEYIQELRALGFNPDEEQIIGLKVQGVTADYVRELKEVGIQGDADTIIGLKVQGVTPTYVRDIRALGLNPTAEEVIGMKVQGVTSEYVKALQTAGFNPSVDDVVSAKIQGLTPEFIETARKHGFQNLTIEKLIELKNMGVLEGKAEI